MTAILAHEFGGFAAVRSMDFMEARYALTYLAELRVGSRVRAVEEQMQATEDAAFAAARKQASGAR